MPRRSDSSDTAASMLRDQATRLARLRQLLGMKQIDAAEAAGVTRDSWGRMERGDTRIDVIALARFLAQTEAGAGYVICGTFEGLPNDLVRDLIRAETEAEAAAETDT
jgi:transcriptional regulator with XRE-family HTH domain